MQYVRTLIDKAAKVCGSDSELARRLGTAQPNVSLMRAGKRGVSPETAAELAEIAGEDARQAVIEAVIERNEGTRRGGLLREILGKGLAAGVAGMLLFSYGRNVNATNRATSESGRAFNTMQIVSISRRRKDAIKKARDAVRSMVKTARVLPRKRGPLPRRFLAA